jgi:4-hydroxy-tetrahydrodipicolinate synthase
MTSPETVTTKHAVSTPHFVSAIGTPLDVGDDLHERGLEHHLEDQWRHGIDGVLVAGSMGLMQLLKDQTYKTLIERATALSRGCGEVLVGAGDTSLARTRERIAFINETSADGVVVLTPYFFQLSQGELIDYYHRLADVSRIPVYIYHLPALTGTTLEFDTVSAIAEHGNIRGIKCSCDLEWTRELIRRIGGRLQILVAQPALVDTLIREGIHGHLDGMYALAPAWVAAIRKAALAEDWEQAARYRGLLADLQALLRSFGVFAAATALLNARGIPGTFAPAPMRLLTGEQQETLLAHPIVRNLLDRE